MSFLKKRDNLIIIGFVAAFFIGLCFWKEGPPFVPGSASADSFSIPFVDKTQKQLTLNQFKGSPLILNFWATWCPVCVQKMATLNRFAGKFQAQGGKVLAISQDRGLNAVQAYYARNGYKNLNIYLEASGSLSNSFNVRGLPTTIFLNAQGQEVGRLEGGIDWDNEDVSKLVNDYFGLSIS